MTTSAADHTRRLLWLNLTLLVLLALHGLDHELRHPVTTPTVVRIIGTLEFLAVLIALSLVLRRHPLAAPATSLAGFAVAAAYAVVHLPPDWGPLSQPYADLDPGALSWLDLVLTIAVGLAVGLIAHRMARPHRPTTTTEAGWPSTER